MCVEAILVLPIAAWIRRNWMVKKDESDSRGIRVFVYGTLKEGWGNWGAYLENNDGARLLGRCRVTGALGLRDLGYFPCAVKTDDGIDRSIVGEVYVVDNATLDALDGLEGHPDWYCREKVNTPWKSAWIYYMPDRGVEGASDFIESGIWNATDEEIEWAKEA